MSELEVTSAVITGGASGIGLAVAERLGARGAEVMLADLPGETLDAAVASLDDKGIIAHGAPCDVSQLDQVEALADAAFETLGRVDLLLNNAGVGGPRGKLWEVPVEDARAHFEVNFWGVWHGCRAFAPRMIAQDTPSAIYNTGSENSFFCALDETSAYIAAKHGVLGLTESFRADLPEHVHTGLLVPGWVFTPLGDERFMKFGMPVEQFADIVVPQLLARERFVVGHAYNSVRITERIGALQAAYDKYAPRYDGDEEYDVRKVLAKMMGGGGSD